MAVLCFLSFSYCGDLSALFFKSARKALAGFLLSTAPERAGHTDKAFEKKNTLSNTRPQGIR
jgi:hypothetical protein